MGGFYALTLENAGALRAFAPQTPFRTTERVRCYLDQPMMREKRALAFA